MENLAAALVLEDGRIHRGRSFGAVGQTLGEAVFTTGMTGYQETLTDPSYRRQIVIATAPEIGNTGWVTQDSESDRIWVAGLAVRNLTRKPSNWRASGTLDAQMRQQQVVGISGIDTRSLVRHLRDRGVMRCGIFSGDALVDDQVMLEIVRDSPHMVGANLTAQVSTRQRYTVPARGDERYVVAAIDLGIKAHTPVMMAARGMRVEIVPAEASYDDIVSLAPDGVFFSNGPGDPASADHAVGLMREFLGHGLPVFGICFGNQILGRALGLGTYKLKFGHRGINQPVKDLRDGRVLISTHNHGFAVDAPDDEFATDFGRARVAFRCLNDDVVEGLECLDAPAFSVQFHPEAAAGPHDAGYLFDEFAALMAANSKGNG